MNTRPAVLLSTEPEAAWRGAVASALRFSVPLVHASPEGEAIEVFARAIRADEPGAASRPWMVYLQGGPGHEALRPQGGSSGWLAQLLPRFQVLLLDQRGTGGSTPLDARALLAVGDPEAQREYLSHFRAPDIVADAEAIREALGIPTWSTLGQSYGGFITLSYLSLAPQSLTRCLITGGLGCTSGDADHVYQGTFARMAEREDEFFARYPLDEQRLAEVYAVVRQRRAAGEPEKLADSTEVTETVVQRLGMFLGGNGRVAGLHYALQGAVVTIGGQRRLAATFLDTLAAQLDHAGHPLYWLLQESIYSSGRPTLWAADRVRAAAFPDFLPTAARPRLLGEMALPADYREVAPLRALADTAQALASTDRWGALYDLSVLAANTVPVAAAVYTHDVYVDRDLSLETAARVKGLRVWENTEMHHDGLADSPEVVLPALFELLGESLAAPATTSA